MGKRKSNKVFIENLSVETVDKVRKFSTREFETFLCVLINAYAREHGLHPAGIGNVVAWMINEAYMKESEVENDS